MTLIRGQTIPFLKDYPFSNSEMIFGPLLFLKKKFFEQIICQQKLLGIHNINMATSFLCDQIFALLTLYNTNRYKSQHHNMPIKYNLAERYQVIYWKKYLKHTKNHNLQNQPGFA